MVGRALLRRRCRHGGASAGGGARGPDWRRGGVGGAGALALPGPADARAEWMPPSAPPHITRPPSSPHSAIPSPRHSVIPPSAPSASSAVSRFRHPFRHSVIPPFRHSLLRALCVLCGFTFPSPRHSALCALCVLCGFTFPSSRPSAIPPFRPSVIPSFRPPRPLRPLRFHVSALPSPSPSSIPKSTKYQNQNHSKID